MPMYVSLLTVTWLQNRFILHNKQNIRTETPGNTYNTYIGSKY